MDNLIKSRTTTKHGPVSGSGHPSTICRPENDVLPSNMDYDAKCGIKRPLKSGNNNNSQNVNQVLHLLCQNQNHHQPHIYIYSIQIGSLKYRLSVCLGDGNSFKCDQITEAA